MKLPRSFRWAILAILAVFHPVASPAGELTILSEKTWDEFVPKGKEVDAIYGDIVLRNDRIVVVIANPIAGRNANMTVRDVGGCVIDLTRRDAQSDQLGAYYPGARQFSYRLDRIAAEGNVVVRGAAERVEADRFTLNATEGKLGAGAVKDPFVVRGDVLTLSLTAPAATNRPEVHLEYTLRDRDAFIEISSEFINTSDQEIQFATIDDFRADRTFDTAPAGETELAWVYDRWWGQAYGVAAPGEKMRLSGAPAAPRGIEFLHDGKPTRTLEAGGRLGLKRVLFPAGDLVAIRAISSRVAGDGKGKLIGHEVVVTEPGGEPVAQAELDLSRDDKPYGQARTNAQGRVRLDLPEGSYRARVSALARGSKELSFEVDGGSASAEPEPLAVQLDAPARIVAEISDEHGEPIPCKVQFVGVEGTPNPFFFPDTGEQAVHNLCYSHNGRFTQEIPPGSYEVLVSYGPEYDLEKLRVSARPGEKTPIRATLRRVVQTPGWVSADYHSHSSPSGDNVSSQLGRVLNLLGEHIEFAPCTEHNRLDTYVPHLRALDAERFMGTCTGIELTGVLGTVNHQNAFPLVMKPRIQDQGAPERDENPDVQIKRLALWDNESDKLVQSNHPDMGEMFFDRNGDGTPDGGFAGMFAYQEVIEVHPHQNILDLRPHRTSTVVDVKNTSTTTQFNSTIFNWLQLVNQGRRLPGVVNTDAHYNFHGSGWIRNYVRCQTDEPSKIDPLDMVHSSEKGHIIMTNGPYLEASISDADAAAREPAIPGDDLKLPGGVATLEVRVQCPNWFDIDRVQVLLNGRKEEKLNWTRSANPDAFSSGVVRFERRIPLELESDTHVIVVAVGENTVLGPVMGPDRGKDHPAAVSNPIFVDVDGGGFKANGDTLGHPLPVKGGKKIDPVTAGAAPAAK